MQDPDPTVGNKPFLPNDKGFWNKKAPFKSEKGAKIITHKRVSKWSWWDSNPRPNIFAECFLHAYFGIDCQETAGAKRTNYFRS